MKTIWNKSKCVLLLLITLVSFSSCFMSDEDDDAEWNMVGQWYVARVSGYSPYERNDIFRFYNDKTFVSYDRYGNVMENGKWRIQNRTLLISFDGWNANIMADMSNFPDNDVILNVTDDYYGNYSLQIVRDY